MGGVVNHRYEASLAVHDAVIMAESERAGATEGVACEQCDGRVREVEDGVDHREEAIGVGERVGVTLVLVDASTPEFGVMPAGDDGTWRVRTQSSLDVVESSDHIVA